MEATEAPAYQIFHALTSDEEEIERAMLDGLAHRAAAFVGSRRDGYDAMSAMTPIAEGVSLAPVDEGGVRGWWVRPSGAPADRAVLFVHGGAYALGSAEGYRGLASQVSARAGVAAFVLDYPLTPENPFPAAPDTVLAALAWLKRSGIDQLALVGDSAGGGLVLGALGARDGAHPAIASAVAFSPWVDLEVTGGSALDPATRDPIFERQAIVGAAAAYLAGADPRDGRASPLHAVPEVLPPIALQVGTRELLLDDARRYAAEAAKRGGTVRLDVFEGLHHVFQRCTEELPSARLALDIAADFITRHWA